MREKPHLARRVERKKLCVKNLIYAELFCRREKKEKCRNMAAGREKWTDREKNKKSQDFF